MKNRIFLLLLCIAMILTLTACGGDGNSSTPEAPEAGEAGEGAAPESGGSDDLTPISAIFEGPVLLTSVGQSADVSIVDTLLDRAGVDATQSNTIAADAMGSGYNTLVLAIGGSSKGLGAAGIDEDEEMDRVTALIAEAQSQGMKILSVHIGGSARRGTLSDKFIPDAIAAADAAIVLSEGDTDNLMRDILIANSTPAAYVEQQIDCVKHFETLFGQ